VELEGHVEPLGMQALLSLKQHVSLATSHAVLPHCTLPGVEIVSSPTAPLPVDAGPVPVPPAPPSPVPPAPAPLAVSSFTSPIEQPSRDTEIAKRAREAMDLVMDRVPFLVT
jgi:hypothetical protein